MKTEKEIDDKRREIDALRRVENQISERPGGFQRGHLSGAQQALYWVLDLGAVPIRVSLTDEQIETMQNMLVECNDPWADRDIIPPFDDAR